MKTENGLRFSSFRPDVLQAFFVLKGLREIETHDEIDPGALKVQPIRTHAWFSSLPRVDRAIQHTLCDWGFTDEDWNVQFLNALCELTTNVVQHVHALPRGQRNRFIEILLFAHEGKRWRYLYAMIADREDDPIDPRRLKTRMRNPHETHGRGTPIVKAFMDFYAIIRGTDGVIVMKKLRRPKQSRSAP